MLRNKHNHDLSLAGGLLSELVNRVSHTSGTTLRIMSDAQVTLQQVLLLTRLRHSSPSSASALASRMHLSLPAISQAIDRLVRLQLVTRVEDPADRRKKAIATTSKGNALLARLEKARAREYAAALAALLPETQHRLAALLTHALNELPLHPSQKD